MTPAMLLLLFACGDTDGDNILDGGATDDSGQDTAPPADTECPVIEHEPIETTQTVGVSVPITATVTDATAVFVVELYFKKETSTTWQRLNMAASPGTSLYASEIPGSQVGSGGMDYYIKAVDTEQYACTLPLDGEGEPFHFLVSED